MFQDCNVNKKLKELRQWFISFLIMALIAVMLRSFVVRTVEVKGESMKPNFHHNDIVLLNQIGYRFYDPEKNDIVICAYDTGVKKEFLIKRVIGLPGDEINIISETVNGELECSVILNGVKIEEDYLFETMQQKGDIAYPYIVPENSYFVMGDNRNASSDSRLKEISSIPKKNIKGEVILRLLPINSVHRIN